MPAEPRVPEEVLVIRCSPSASLEAFPVRGPLSAAEQVEYAQSGWAVREMVDRARLAEVEAERDVLTANFLTTEAERDEARRARDRIRGHLGDRQLELDKARDLADRYRSALRRLRDESRSAFAVDIATAALAPEEGSTDG